MRRSEPDGGYLSAVSGSIAIHGFILSVLLVAAYTVSPVLIQRDSARLQVSWVTFPSGARGQIRQPATKAWSSSPLGSMLTAGWAASGSRNPRVIPFTTAAPMILL